jgi:hypothetical protein
MRIVILIILEIPALLHVFLGQLASQPTEAPKTYWLIRMGIFHFCLVYSRYPLASLHLTPRPVLLLAFSLRFVYGVFYRSEPSFKLTDLSQERLGACGTFALGDGSALLGPVPSLYGEFLQYDSTLTYLASKIAQGREQSGFLTFDEGLRFYRVLYPLFKVSK